MQEETDSTQTLMKQTRGTKAERSEKDDRGGGEKRFDIWYWSLTRHSKKKGTMIKGSGRK